MGVIYVRPNLINGKKYVGQATTKRFKQRQRDWKNLNKPYAGPAINNARAKYGIDNFGFEILKECDDKELDFWEKYYVKELNTKSPYGYNLTDGGDGCKGYHHTEETKQKISDAKKGKKQSEEARKKLSEANKGKHLTEETKKKLSEANKGEKNSNYGKHHTDETKHKISKSLKGIPNIKLSKPVLQIDKNTNEIIKEFPSIMEINRQLGISVSHISECCKGKRHSAYGYIWKYAV